MIELLIVACLIDDPAQCKDIVLTYASESVTPLQCAMGAQPEIAKWITEHPRWQVARWSCRPAGRFAKT